jgi:osmotically-inducible protein OsmY
MSDVPSVSSVHQVIEQAIERHAQRAARHVRVAIVDGTVFLTGEVRSWAELTAIEGAVRAIAGVKRIDSQLRIVA